MENNVKKKVKLSFRQIEAIEYLQKNGRVFASYNCHLHAATIRFLIKAGIAKVVDDYYLVLNPKFKKLFKTT